MANTKYEYKSDFAKKYVAEGREQGREEGRAEGAREILLAMLAARGLGPSEVARARVSACVEIAVLEQWILRAASAGSEAEVFRAS